MGEWRIDTNTMEITDSEKGHRYTWDEYHEHDRPPCPECGLPIHVEPIPGDSLGPEETEYQPSTSRAWCEHCPWVLRP